LVLLSIVRLEGLPATVNLMDVTFEAVGGEPACVTIHTVVTAAADTTGSPITAQAHHGMICHSGATPAPFTPPATIPASPTPLPGIDVLIGLDHDGGSPDINEGPAQIPTGGASMISVVAETVSMPVGAWQVTLLYDPMIVTAVDCQGMSGSVCNHNTGGSTVSIAGANVAGLPPVAELARVTFVEAYEGSACGMLVPELDLVADTEGNTLTGAVFHGGVCVGGGMPTPLPTYPPFPSPTPGGTAGPTPPPGGGPPVFDPAGTMCWDNFETTALCDGDSSPGAASDIMFMTCVGWGENCDDPGWPVAPEPLDSAFATTINFIPPEFDLQGAQTPVGALSGYMGQSMVLSLLNGPCSAAIGVQFSLIKASTNPADTIDTKGAGLPDPMAPLAEDMNPLNGVPDGADRYPRFLSDHLNGAQPRERLFGATKVQGSWITYNILVFEPGARIASDSGFDWTFDPALGYPMLFVFDDPTSSASPGAITDICTPMRTAMMLFGTTLDNPCTPLPAASGANCPGEAVRQNAGYPFVPCETGNTADEDGDGFVNDGCPRVLAVAESGGECVNSTSDDPEDSSVNDGCPAVGDAEYVRSGACLGTDEGACVHHRNPSLSGTYGFTSAVTSHRDADSDGIDNTLDVCALEHNPDWDPRATDVADDADSDGLPNACDPNPNTASPLTPLSCPDGILGADEDQDCAPNRGDNCPRDNQLANPQLPPGPSNPVLMVDQDNDGIGDACDPNPDQPNGQQIGYCLQYSMEVGGTPAQVTGTKTGLVPECAWLEVPAQPVPGAGTPTPTAAQTPATPIPTPVVTPTPTALAAVALPQTGGAGEGGGSALLVGAIGLAGAMGAAWVTAKVLTARRR
jgi:hypothetical protein